MLRANEDQAKAAGALVELQRDSNARMVSIESETREQTNALKALIEHIGKMDSARDNAVKDVKEHLDKSIKLGLQGSEQWWRKTLWIAVGLIALSNLLGATLNRVVELLKR